MRKIFLFMMVSLDGYFEGPNHDLTWHNVDEEFNDFAIEQIDQMDTLLFGRVTYEMMASYWPTMAAIREDPIVAKKMNSTPKIVFSKTLERADWENTRLSKDAGETIRQLKGQPGRNLAIFGSNNLVVSLAQEGLVDEFRIMVNPVAIGAGTPLFAGIGDKLNLKLVDTKTFKNGNVLLSYQPAK